MLNNTTTKPLNQNKMKPKEKAQELVEKFWTEVEDNDYQTRKMSFEQAKQCALIAVEQILNDDWYIPSFDEMMERMKYWEQVKNEINNL